MFQNIEIKIFALLFASLFWFFIISSTNQIKTLNYNLAIEPAGLAENLVILNKNSLPKVKIYYRSNSNNLASQNLTTEDFSVKIKLNDLTEGTYTLPILASVNFPEVEIINFIPKEINLIIETKQTREFIPEIKIEGRAKNGYRITKSETKNDKIFVFGAQSLINQIDRVEAKTILLGFEATKQTKKAELKAYNSENKVIEELEFDPATIDIDIDISLDEEIKTVGILPDLDNIFPKEGYYIKNIKISPPVATIKGKNEVIKNIEHLLTQKIPVNTLEQNYADTLFLAIPDDINIVQPADRKVSIILEIASLSFQREILATINLRNLQSKFDIEYDQNILVNLTGSPSSLNNINDSDVRLMIDLKNINSTGEKRIEIKKTDFVYPQNITLVDFYPKTFDMNITSK